MVPPRAVTLIVKVIGDLYFTKFGSKSNEKFEFPYITLVKFTGSIKLDYD